MRIAVDAMGGDHAPGEVVAGCVAAARDLGIEIHLVGPEDRVRAEIRAHGGDRLSLRVAHAPEVIEMHESPAQALRRKRLNSISVGLELVRDGRADAFVSAGNTGAAMAAAVLTLGRIEGIDRPAIATALPTLNGRIMVLDAGANVDCKPKHLLQFALMGSAYVEHVLGVTAPRIGIISNGEEATKGNELVLHSAELLRASGLNFVGNIEGRDLFAGKADVAVCDGFVGNVILKFGEGIALGIFQLLRQELGRGLVTRLAAGLLRPRLRRILKRMDYAEYGGAPLLGVRGVCIISHGSSRAKAVRNAVAAAADSAGGDTVRAIRDTVRHVQQVAPASLSTGD
ncbi:MAG: phosphate acyltransferase PlsX [Armatimonadetes bacterium]|nr:phosphate acyltransferase PlsX [Armatimonadota bacterium]